MTANFGDGESVRRLGQALLGAARELSSATDDLSRHVKGLVPSGWSGDPAHRFAEDWNGKAGQARRLAAVCQHVGQVLTGLADQLDGANQQATAAEQMSGGVASRFAAPGTEQRSQRMLSQATGAVEQARAAARAKLAGIQVPRFGRGLTARQVGAWASRLLAQPSMPGLDHFLHDAGTFTLGQLHGVRDTGAGLWDGYEGLSSGLWHLIDVGSPSFRQSWDGIGRLFEVWDPSAMESAWGGLEKSLVSWDEWRSDPGRALGNTVFNAASLIGPGKILRDTAAPADVTGTVEAGGTEGQTAEQALARLPDNSQATLHDGAWIAKVNGQHLYLSPEENDAAQGALERAAAAEPGITSEMQLVTGSLRDEIPGAKLVGPDTGMQLKSAFSFKRKFQTLLTRRSNADPHTIASRINDAVRYTIELPADQYADGVNRVADHLRADGFQPVKPAKDFWEINRGTGRYKGINSTWRDPVTGQSFELQFHTPASLWAKEATHPYYEVERLPDATAGQRQEAMLKAAEIFTAVQEPPGLERIKDW